LVLGAALAPQALADELPPHNREAAGRCCFTWSGFYLGANAGAAWRCAFQKRAAAEVMAPENGVARDGTVKAEIF